MKMTIEQLEKKYNQAQLDAQKTQEDIELQTEKVLELKQAEFAAAEAGDVDRYQTLKKQRENMEDLIFVKRTAKNRTFNQQDVYDTWKDYAAGYNKELARRTKDFEKACAELKDLFMEMVKLQDNGMENRARCATFLGIENTLVNAPQIREALPMDEINAPNVPALAYGFQVADGDIVLNVRTAKPAIAFLGAAGLVTPGELALMWKVLHANRAE